MFKTRTNALLIASLVCAAGLYRNAEPGVDGTGSSAPAAPPPAPTAEQVKAAQQAAKEQAKKAAEEAKAQKAAEKEAAKQAKAAEKAAEKAKKEEEKKAAEEAKSAAKAATPEQNGIKRPKSGTATGRVWEIADHISGQLEAPASIRAVLEAGKAEGLNDATIKTQYARWRQFHGVTGYVMDPRVAEEKARKEAEKQAAAEKAKAEKEAAKQAKAEADAKAKADAEAAAKAAQAPQPV